MADVEAMMKDCTLCPRNCHADRSTGLPGFCRSGGRVRAARAALHYWEEPCICGEEGSGAVFFSGCSLGCVYCQNRPVADGTVGKEITVERLAEIFLELQAQNARNINLVTASHFIPQTAEALVRARQNGLSVPVVYNTGGYEKAETLKLLEGLVDIYLPDFKYMDEQLAQRYSQAADYPQVAKAAVREMVRQCPVPVFDGQGLMQKGVIVRHLLLPGHVREAKAVVQYLYETYGDQIYISMMNQYTPMAAGAAQDPLLGRRVTAREYGRLLDFAAELGVTQGFYQEGETAMESFIPPFDCEGVLPEQNT